MVGTLVDTRYNALTFGERAPYLSPGDAALTLMHLYISIHTRSVTKSWGHICPGFFV